MQKRNFIKQEHIHQQSYYDGMLEARNKDATTTIHRNQGHGIKVHITKSK